MDVNDYDDLRKKNIAERNAVFAEFFKDVKKQTKALKGFGKNHADIDDSENQPPRKRRRTISGPISENDVKHSRYAFRKKYNTRSRSKNENKDNSDPTDNDDEDNDDSVASKRNRPKLQVLFPWAKPFQRSIDLMQMGVCDVDQEEEQYYSDDSYNVKKKTIPKAQYDPDTIPSVEEITDELLDNIAEKSSTKQYCKLNGTSCHQCRQKTLDTKTVCRSGECIGIRGQFCGPCLRGRYGESAAEALKDPNWACPPCRGLCNCSICRTRSGLPPTGILAPIVHEEGYSSVMDYLQCTETEDI